LIKKESKCNRGNLYKKLGFEIVEPVCEADEDDNKYIMAVKIPKIINNLERPISKR